ncbi:MAG: class I SAM-dependent methyltransferase [Armatimonadetes bacterium]|nr:class I SAM-dependent methyltransferase [Armatimonadota bacterium]
MNPEEYGRMHDLETTYWWFVGRRLLFARLLKDVLAHRDSVRLIDLGCGTGANLPMLREAVGPRGAVFGLDFSPLALQFARGEIDGSNLYLSQGDAMRLPLRDEATDCVTMLDVLEHLPDDNRALCEVMRILKPGGVLLLSVPAYQHLWSAHDEALHHFRRYERAQLGRVLRDAGFKIEKLSFAMSLMPPIAWFWRRFVLPFGPHRPKNAQRHSQGAILPQVPDWANDLLARYVEIEGKIIVRRPIRFGTSLVAVARKKD